MGSGPVGTSLSDSAPNPVVLRSSSAPCTPEDRAGESKNPGPGKRPSEKEPPFLDPSPHRSTAAGVFVFLPCSRPPSPASPARCPWAPLSRAVAMQPLCRGRKRQVLGESGRTKKTRFGLRCARARVLRTSPVGRGGGRRQAGQDHSDGEQGDDGRVSHPARRGGLAYAAANTRKATEEMEEQEEPGLPAPKPSAVRPLPQRVGFARLVGTQTKSRRVEVAGALLICSPIRGTVTCRGYTWRASGALITPESSPAAPSRPAPYAWDPRSRDGGGAARPPGGHPGASERRERPSSRLSLTSQTAGSPSRWTILQLHSMDSFSLFRLETVEKLEDLNFKMSSAFYYPQNQSGSAT